MSRKRLRLGQRDICVKCNQEIEWSGRGRGGKGWWDRGGGRECAPYLDYRRNEVVRPKGNHVPRDAA